MGVKLVASSGGSVELVPTNTASNFTVTVPAVTASMLTDSSGVMNIGSGQIYKDSSGNVGIGTSSPISKLTVSGVTSFIDATLSNRGLEFQPGDNTNNRCAIWTNSGTRALAFGTNQTEQMRIDSSGNLLVGSTSGSGNAERLFAKGSGTGSGTYTAIFSNSASTYIFGARDDGAIYTPTIGTSTGTALILTASGFIAKSSSSIRYKKDVEPIDIGLDFVLGLEPVKYNLKDGDTPQVGFIAEDFPDTRLVSESMVDPQDETKGSQREGVNYANLVAPLVKAIQEQQAIITSLTDRITALENK